MDSQVGLELIGFNLRRLRCAVMVTQEALADAIDIDLPTLSALERGYGVLPIKAFPSLAAAFGISFQELIIELAKNDTQVALGKQTVSDMAALTADRVEIIRLRDAIEAERQYAERQFEFLAKRNGMSNIFTREAAGRMERLAIVLGLGPDEVDPGAHQSRTRK
jgi:transcriptional regulator with XRE-family HTH domain